MIKPQIFSFQIDSLSPELIKFIIILAIVIVVLIIISSIIKSIRRKINRLKHDLLGGLPVSSISQILKGIDESSQEPEVKSVGGMTNIYEPLIRKDFADFHNSEAISAIKVLIYEYLDIKNQVKENFEESNVDEGLRYMISVSDIKRNVSNITFNNVVIQNYVKTNEYATITYGVSIGYTLGNNEKMQERYKVEYTLKLRDDNMEKDILICENCGATLESTGIESCPYCGTRIIRDTKMSWKFTSIQIS